jgi:hypothetical protein
VPDKKLRFRISAGKIGIKPAFLRVSPVFSDSIRSWERFQETLRGWVAKLAIPVGLFAVNDKVPAA